MTETSELEQLTRITEFILKEEINYSELKNALDDYKSLLFEVSGLDFDDPVNREHIYLDTGKAIGTKWAAMCIDDLMRTKRFICGVNKAVQHIKKTKKDQPVIILYCGTGPFASLVLPLITLYKPSELQLVLLEINPISLKSLKNIITGFKASDYIKNIYECDASKYELPSSNGIDIVLLECMQQALEREPQVAVTYNIIPQLKEEVILIPEQISLHIALINSVIRDENLEYKEDVEAPEYHKNSKTVFMLNKEVVLKRVKEFGKEALLFPKVETLFSIKDIAYYNEIAISTEITIFEHEKLSINDSGLTMPKILRHFKEDEKIKGVGSKYVATDHPELEISFI